mgnify:CR=1 FL=1|jgi:hypothetical protein
MQSCCNSKKKTCKRKDGKVFKLPRRFTKNKCLTNKIKGFSMRSSCAPYKYCKNNKQNGGKKQFLYYPNNPKKSFDVYIDKNPSDTISIKYTTILDVQNTIKKLENLYKSGKYPHKRIWQVGMIMKVRLEAINKYKNTKYPNAKYVNERYNLANKYFKFLGDRTKLPEDKRKKLTFKF